MEHYGFLEWTHEVCRTIIWIREDISILGLLTILKIFWNCKFLFVHSQFTYRHFPDRWTIYIFLIVAHLIFLVEVRRIRAFVQNWSSICAMKEFGTIWWISVFKSIGLSKASLEPRNKMYRKIQRSSVNIPHQIPLIQKIPDWPRPLAQWQIAAVTE